MRPENIMRWFVPLFIIAFFVIFLYWSGFFPTSRTRCPPGATDFYIKDYYHSQGGIVTVIELGGCGPIDLNNEMDVIAIVGDNATRLEGKDVIWCKAGETCEKETLTYLKERGEQAKTVFQCCTEGVDCPKVCRYMIGVKGRSGYKILNLAFSEKGCNESYYVECHPDPILPFGVTGVTEDACKNCCGYYAGVEEFKIEDNVCYCNLYVCDQ
jgi:hypothetical protein